MADILTVTFTACLSTAKMASLPLGNASPAPLSAEARLPETFRCPVTEASTARMGQQAPAPGVGLSPKLTEMGKSLPIDLHMFGFRFLINDLFINVNNKFVPYIPSAYYVYLYQVKQLKHRLSTVTYSLRV